ncbi:tRNA (N6-threonylcarbamoyladenosine(37)-N6)-methyltransferase TrmO [Natronoflexus pectinivorans]|uniref:Formylmethanofuran dehydrogenase subunit E n=1 Tax=Natronoflexus pectinivorans TaxID=682526 RepID=A0A4R2GBT7_9BACT|nr:tRNA (N6-threonylcarbamoyladenosine(37)-N6)-methyltransferase TrmO [Natronoflexus pectinivorans]TCO05406.1 formylmethanofuran dehydrogenase subunit E [Natronoflexus pectinivorans]
MDIHFQPIGYVKNQIIDPKDGFVLKKEKSVLEILPEFADGLQNLNELAAIDVVFNFHRSQNYKLITPIYTGEIKGVFASRSPHRPNGIGVTTVKLHSVEGNQLTVTGLDAMNETPILDIKPADYSFYENSKSENKIRVERLKGNPRAEIIMDIKSENLEKLLIGAAQIHGHYCPGLAMGVIAAVKAMNQIKNHSDGMEDLLAITETNNCFADGVQYITGCSFGNNALIFRDIGKNAFTLTTRNGKGIRVCAKNDSRLTINQKSPEFSNLFQQVVIEQNHDENIKREFRKAASKASFATLTIPFNDIFKIEDKETSIPPYAPIMESIVCDVCKENTMKSRITEVNNENLCLDCSATSQYVLDGHGIKCT